MFPSSIETPLKGNTFVLFLALIIGVYVHHHTIPVLPALRNVLARREVVPKHFELDHLARHFANDTTILITAKDTCSQTLDVLHDLRQQIPGETAVRISLPTTLGCKDILAPSMETVYSLFSNTVVNYHDNFNPFTAWRLDAVAVTTKYTMLMHNDVYFIDAGGVLKIYETMRNKERDGYKVVVPMIYEREGNVTLSPHAVHSDLHIDYTTTPPTLGHMMDLRKGLMRWSDQMTSGEQTHFLEDHAFMVSTSFIDKLIDPGSAFTMEYIDMYLNMMHEDGVKPFFDPEVRIEFRVRHDDLSLGDIPYMAGRRSEINALGNHRYLEQKWKAQFFFTSAWNYIKFATMRDTHSYSVEKATPDFVEEAGLGGCFKNTLFFTWFEFIGMNHYDGKRLWALEKDLCNAKVNKERTVTVSRRVKSNIEVPEHWQDRDSKVVLPSKTLSQNPFTVKPRMDFKMYPTLVLKAKYGKDETPSDVCGMVVKKKDTEEQDCFIFVPPFEYDRENSWHIWFMEKMLSIVKTASRSSIYYCLRNKMQDLTEVSKLIQRGSTREVTSYYCDGVTMDQDYNDQRCSFDIDFNPEDELTTWSGKLHSVKHIVKQLL